MVTPACGSAAVPVFRVLCVAGVFQAWGSSVGWMYVSAGKTREMFRWGMAASAVTVLGLLPCIWFGGMGAAVGYTAAVLVFVLPAGQWYMARSVGIDLKPLLKTAAGPLAATLVMCAAVVLLKRFVTGPMTLWPRLLVLVPSGAAALAIGAALFARAALKEAETSLKSMLGRAS